MREKEQVQQQGLVSKATQKAKKKGEFNARAGNIAQLAKSLTHKHEGLSLILI